MKKITTVAAVVLATAGMAAGCGSNDKSSQWTEKSLTTEIRSQVEANIAQPLPGARITSLKLYKLDDHNARGILEVDAEGQHAKQFFTVEIGKTGAVAFHPEGDPVIAG